MTLALGGKPINRIVLLYFRNASVCAFLQRCAWLADAPAPRKLPRNGPDLCEIKPFELPDESAAALA
jgi:hypothetical protein